MHMQCKTVSGAPHSDYNSVSGEIVQFNVGDTYQTHTIIINDDIDCEDDSNENFFSVIALNDGVQPINVINPRATVTIDDSEEVECSKYILLNTNLYTIFDILSVVVEVGYEFTVYTTTEGEGFVTLCAVVMNSDEGSPRHFVVSATTDDGIASKLEFEQKIKHLKSLFSIWC